MHSTSTHPPLFTFTCPHCPESMQVLGADSTVGHRCPARRNAWVLWRREGE